MCPGLFRAKAVHMSSYPSFFMCLCAINLVPIFVQTFSTWTANKTKLDACCRLRERNEWKSADDDISSEVSHQCRSRVCREFWRAECFDAKPQHKAPKYSCFLIQVRNESCLGTISLTCRSFEVFFPSFQRNASKTCRDTQFP